MTMEQSVTMDASLLGGEDSMILPPATTTTTTTPAMLLVAPPVVEIGAIESVLLTKDLGELIVAQRTAPDDPTSAVELLSFDTSVWRQQRGLLLTVATQSENLHALLSNLEAMLQATRESLDDLKKLYVNKFEAITNDLSTFRTEGPIDLETTFTEILLYGALPNEILSSQNSVLSQANIQRWIKLSAEACRKIKTLTGTFCRPAAAAFYLLSQTLFAAGLDAILGTSSTTATTTATTSSSPSVLLPTIVQLLESIEHFTTLVVTFSANSLAFFSWLLKYYPAAASDPEPATYIPPDELRKVSVLLEHGLQGLRVPDLDPLEAAFGRVKAAFGDTMTTVARRLERSYRLKHRTLVPAAQPQQLSLFQTAAGIHLLYTDTGLQCIHLGLLESAELLVSSFELLAPPVPQKILTLLPYYAKNKDPKILCLSGPAAPSDASDGTPIMHQIALFDLTGTLLGTRDYPLPVADATLTLSCGRGVAGVLWERSIALFDLEDVEDDEDDDAENDEGDDQADAAAGHADDDAAAE
jgi:hypothetical protein